MRTPQVGEMVFYTTEWGAIRPAIVTSVNTGGLPSLSVLTDGVRDSRWTFEHPMWKPDVPYGTALQPNTWAWADDGVTSPPIQTQTPERR